MTMSPEERIADSLTRADFVQIPDYLSPLEIEALVSDFEAARARGDFSRAGVGRGETREIRDDVRRDEILWLEPRALTPAQKHLWERLENLKNEINARLFLGLWSLEGHYAQYPPGGFYERHVDRFRDDDKRTISVVLYLNEAWQEGDGGELEIFAEADSTLVEPRAGTLVCFTSATVEHAVRPSKKDRRSFAGWFRRRS